MSKITISQWDENKFSNSQDEWNELLANSNVDQLFLSWEWQYTWWQVFAIPSQMQLCLLVATDDENNLVGIASLYLSTVTAAKFLKVRRLQFIGNCWRTRDTMRTELLDFITLKSRSTEITRSLFEYLRNSKEWDEFIIAGLREDSETYHILSHESALPGCYLRRAESYPSYYLSTKGNFADYLNSLGKNTRLRLFNRRKILESLGRTIFSVDHENIDNNFELLNKLHLMRWGYPAFSKQRLEFNKKVATLLSARNGLCFSKLSVNNSPISIQYNYEISNHVYNIQGGFDDTIHHKLAPGYLHFGYVIERAFNNETTCYDFLAGEGKNTPYKENLTEKKLDIVDMQVIRNKLLKILYTAYELVKTNE
jgi:hypothetical protein